jgi:hypothetical protein
MTELQPEGAVLAIMLHGNANVVNFSSVLTKIFCKFQSAYVVRDSELLGANLLSLWHELRNFPAVERDSPAWCGFPISIVAAVRP